MASIASRIEQLGSVWAVLLLAACAAPTLDPMAVPESEPTDPDWRYGIVDRNVVAPDGMISTRAQRSRVITIRADDGEILEITTAGGSFAVGACVTLEASGVKPAPSAACEWFAD